MLAGFVLHDLATFPQSYPRPDLTHLPPEAVIECGELWAKAAGSARLTRQAAWILAGQLKAQAILVYPLFKPWNLSTSYNGDFDRIGAPIEWPYIRTLDGDPMFVQAMVSSGAKLSKIVIKDSIKTWRQLAFASEALHQDAVADQQVVEGPMQGLEESAAVSAIVSVRHLGGGIIEPFVAPSVIAGKHGISRFYRTLPRNEQRQSAANGGHAAASGLARPAHADNNRTWSHRFHGRKAVKRRDLLQMTTILGLSASLPRAALSAELTGSAGSTAAPAMAT